MAASIEDANRCFQLVRSFDGDMSALPRYSFPFMGGYCCAAYLECTNGLKLFIASVPQGIIGGHRWRGRVDKETLCVLVLTESEVFGRDYQTLIPARFFWLTRRQRFRRAKLFYATDTMQSVVLTAYDAEKQKLLAVHRVLGWTFRCPLALMQYQWLGDYDVHHCNNQHNDNGIYNLYCWRASGKAGHRSYSGWFGAQEMLRRRRMQDGEEEEEEEVEGVQNGE